MSNDDKKNWRDKEPGLKNIIDKYPDVSPFIIIKIDVQRRGVTYSPAALGKVDPSVHMTQVRSDYYEKDDPTPVSLTMRDGTSIFNEGFLDEHAREPYLVDVINDKIYLVDEDEVIEEVFYWEKPDYYNKVTSHGVPMWQVVSARPQRLTIHPNQFCDFWKKHGQGCKFCVMASTFKASQKPALPDVEDIVETVGVALKEPGRNESVFLTGGSLLDGVEPLDQEVDLYVSILERITEFFGGKKFPSQLISTAFTHKQLQRLWNTGLTSYTADLEVLNHKLFDWICPGKAALIGYEGWKQRLYRAVEIFGPGNVNTGIVSGVETATPFGFKTESEALEATLAEAHELASHGVFTVGCVWRVLKGSVFFNQTTPSLDYYVHLARGLNQIRKNFGLSPDMDNYRRCGNHPDTDLARTF